MQDLKKAQQDAQDLFDQAREPLIETSPFLYNFTARTLQSGAWGALLATLLLRGRGRLRRGFVFGAGFGVGLSSSQI